MSSALATTASSTDSNGPESRPLRSLGTGALVTLSTAAYLYGEGDVALPFLAGGLVATLLAVGPGASSDFGRRVGVWFRGIGVAGRFAVIAAYAVAVYAALFVYRPPTVPILSAVLGLSLALDCYVVYRIARYRGR